MFSLRFRSLELLYSITSDSVCQELFSSFFKLFRKLSLCAPPSRTASIYYHAPDNLSSTKLKVFQLFSYPPLTDLLQGRSTTETSDQHAPLTIMSSRGSAASRGIFAPIQVKADRKDRPTFHITKREHTRPSSISNMSFRASAHTGVGISWII